MRIIVDIQIRRPNKTMAAALAEISRRHDGFSSHVPYERHDHETYDIAMAALEPRHWWKVRRYA